MRSTVQKIGRLEEDRTARPKESDDLTAMMDSVATARERNTRESWCLSPRAVLVVVTQSQCAIDTRVPDPAVRQRTKGVGGHFAQSRGPRNHRRVDHCRGLGLVLQSAYGRYMVRIE